MRCKKVSMSTQTSQALSHSELCRIACEFLRREGFRVVFDDRFRARTKYGELPDAIGFRNGASCLIEAKCSRADFLKDGKKRFRLNPEKGMGDWRFFLAEPGIIQTCDLPEGWGLLHVINGEAVSVCGWKGNTGWLRREKKPFRANKQAECDFMYSALRRLDIRGYLDEVYQGFVQMSGEWEKR